MLDLQTIIQDLQAKEKVERELRTYSIEKGLDKKIQEFCDKNKIASKAQFVEQVLKLAIK